MLFSDSDFKSLSSLAWHKHLAHESIADFAQGLKEVGEQFGISLWGGDTVRTDGSAVLTATLIGECPKGMSVKRRGAKPGDDIWLSGFLGKGYFGLRAITESRENDDIFYKPPPRIELKSILRTYASAAVDVSDGLAADLEHLLKASHISGQVDAGCLSFPPHISQWLDANPGGLEILLSHGDDYEVIFTAHPDHREAIARDAKELGFPLTRIGACGLGEGLRIHRDGQDIELTQAGYSHF